MRSSRMASGVVAASWLVAGLLACIGPRGPEGAQGPPGPGADAGAGEPQGDAGLPGPAQCEGLAAVSLNVSAPANGQFFTPGERPSLTISFQDHCGRALAASALGTANLYLMGPRSGLTGTTANRLLNCVMDRRAPDRQHHYINLISPRFAEPAEANLTRLANGTITYLLHAVSDEAPGTYTAGVWAKTVNDVDQIFELAELQIGTATREEFASGPTASSSCYDCHLGKRSGKSYEYHIVPGRSPLGNYALDQWPIATCLLCHNRDSYSPNPTVRRVHGVHHGANLTSPGVAHPEYGLPDLDRALADFTNVHFPALPGAEKNCAKCHADDRWKTRISRLACGTCHDNVFFDTGTLNPPHVLGTPPTGPCTTNADCSSFGLGPTCQPSTGECVHASHPVQNDDAQCGTCHADSSVAPASVVAVHDVPGLTKIRGLKVNDISVSGASGPNDTFVVNDRPTITFSLRISDGSVVTDLQTRPSLSGTFLAAGPTEDPEPIVTSTNMKTAGTLVFDANQGLYSYTPPLALQATSLAPLNGDPADTRTNPSGTYTFYMYFVERFSPPGQPSFSDSDGVAIPFKLLADQPLRPREIITRTACNGCHIDLQLHGGSRSDPEACMNCHTRGAQDRAVGSRGIACTDSATCPGNAAGWETCQDTDLDLAPDTCVMVSDPTPNSTIRFSWLVHSIHFARRRGEYSQRLNLQSPGRLAFVGFRNRYLQFDEVLLPVDARNCTNCHADSEAACGTTLPPCGYGQECVAGRCANNAWKRPIGEVCLGCHDRAATVGHVMLNTWQGTSPPIETCDVCHGPFSEFAVEKVHSISNPYVPPYPRTRAP